MTENVEIIGVISYLKAVNMYKEYKDRPTKKNHLQSIHRSSKIFN